MVERPSCGNDRSESDRQRLFGRGFATSLQCTADGLERGGLHFARHQSKGLFVHLLAGVLLNAVALTGSLANRQEGGGYVVGRWVRGDTMQTNRSAYESAADGSGSPADEPSNTPIDFGNLRFRFDTFVSEPSDPNRTIVSVAPTLWWNDMSDATVGVRIRSNDGGRYNRVRLWLGRGVSGPLQTTDNQGVEYFLRLENPSFLGGGEASQLLESWWVEGTSGVRLVLAKSRVAEGSSTGSRGSGWFAQWVATPEVAFLDRSLWDNAGTVELGRFDDWDFGAWGGDWKVRLEYRGGMSYRRPGARTEPLEPFGRVKGAISLRKPIAGFVIGVRAFAGFYVARDAPVAQRGIALHGADPYETLRNPLVRTDGAPLVRDNVFYHSPGNGNIRGFRPGLGGRWLVAGNLELEKYIFQRTSGVLRSASLVGFGDAALVDTLAVRSALGSAVTPLSNAGVGIRVGWHLGDIEFPLRLEFPLFVSEPTLANEKIPGRKRTSFRWLISLQPIF